MPFLKGPDGKARTLRDPSGVDHVNTNEPASSVGTSSDQIGDVVYGSTYIYYCFAEYDGSSSIWKRKAYSADTWS